MIKGEIITSMLGDESLKKNNTKHSPIHLRHKTGN